MSTANFLDAISVVKENERISVEAYTKAAAEIQSPIGKHLFEQLAEFEKFHFEKLSNLEKSLMEQDRFIHYEGKVFPIPPLFEITAAKEVNQKTVMKIITDAMALEKQAEKAYADLAAEITDQEGHAMFDRLSREEYEHYCVLREAFWTLNNLGVWRYNRPIHA